MVLNIKKVLETHFTKRNICFDATLDTHYKDRFYLLKSDKSRFWMLISSNFKVSFKQHFWFLVLTKKQKSFTVVSSTLF